MKGAITPTLRLQNGILLGMLLVAIFTFEAGARSFRVSMFPNGNSLSCSACHVRSSGGGPRTPFGEETRRLVGSSRNSFWTASLAALDSDGDGFTNGQELGDPDGTWRQGDAHPSPSEATNPGDASSKPEIVVNSAPEISSTPPESGFFGEPIEYQIIASDADNDVLAYDLMDSPEWLSMTSDGTLIGTPPATADREFTVTVRVSDGKEEGTADQTFRIRLAASFAGWRELVLNDQDGSLAGDPDGDGVPNLVAYALGLDPTAGAGFTFPSLGFDSENRGTLEFDVRGDDPKLGIFVDVSSSVDFAVIESLEGEILDDDEGTGRKRVRFRDSLDRSDNQRRFFRLRVTLSE